MVSGILLAAGESRRAGALKQLLPFGSSTIIEEALGCLLQGEVEEVVVVLGHEAPRIRRHLEDVLKEESGRLRIAVNEGYREGMLSSIWRGSRASSLRSC